MECNSRCFDPRKDSVQSTLCKHPNLSALSDMKNLLPSLRMSLSPNFAGSLKSSFPVIVVRCTGRNELGKTHSDVSFLYKYTHDTLRSSFFSGNCVSSRFGRVSASGKQGSHDATDWALRKEDSAQPGVSSLPLHAQIKACSLHQIRESASFIG